QAEWIEAAASCDARRPDQWIPRRGFRVYHSRPRDRDSVGVHREWHALDRRRAHQSLLTNVGAALGGDVPARIRWMARKKSRRAGAGCADVFRRHVGCTRRPGGRVRPMKLLLTGLNHKTAPVEVRERLAFEEKILPEALDDLKRRPGLEEGLIL